MKRLIYSTLLLAAVFGMTACGNDSNTTGSTSAGDSTNSTNMAGTSGSTEGGSANSTSANAAFNADSIERNSAAGYYVNARTGKPMRLKVNRENNAVTDETGAPVYRYVDTRNWWVYGLDDSDWTWHQQGQARMDDTKKSLTYRNESDSNWTDYDARWKSSDEKVTKGWKEKFGDTKVKVGKDGDIKIKDEDGKVKYDADDNKIKTDDDKKKQ